MPEPEDAPRPSDELYVGYLPVPPGQRRFLTRLVPVLLAAVVAAGALIAAGQRDPGPAVWEAFTTRPVDGVLRLRPYPMLELGLDGESPQLVLLVDQGKHGVVPRVAGLDGRRVTVRGQALRRGDLRLLELADEPDPITPRDAGPPATAAAAAGESTPVTLEGEIIDVKCFAGAMKPGDGKPHKACATLCLRGGIPPVFAAPLPGGGTRHYLLVDPSGRPLTGDALDAVLPYVADPVRVTGAARPLGDAWLLAVDAGAFRRL